MHHGLRGGWTPLRKYTHTHTYIHPYMYIYIHTYTYKYIHTHMYTYICPGDFVGGDCLTQNREVIVWEEEVSRGECPTLQGKHKLMPMEASYMTIESFSNHNNQFN